MARHDPTLGFFDWFSSSDSSIDDPAKDTERGQELLRAYYDAVKEFNDIFPTFESFMAKLKSVQGNAFVDEFLGMAVRFNKDHVSMDKAKELLETIAYETGGQIPANPQSVFAKVINEYAADPSVVRVVIQNFVPLTWDVAQQAVATAVDVSQNVGSGVLDTARMLKFLPYILLGAGALYIVSRGAGAKSLKGIMSK